MYASITLALFEQPQIALCLSQDDRELSRPVADVLVDVEEVDFCEIAVVPSQAHLYLHINYLDHYSC